MNIHQLQTGSTLPVLQLPAISRTTLALYAGASGDHNPIHIDLDFARQAGMNDVFAHGMLTMAYLGRLLTNWVSPDQIRSFKARFVGITNLGDRVVCHGKVVQFLLHRGEEVVRIEIEASNQSGETRVLGEALIGNHVQANNLNLFFGLSI